MRVDVRLCCSQINPLANGSLVFIGLAAMKSLIIIPRAHVGYQTIYRQRGAYIWL